MPFSGIFFYWQKKIPQEGHSIDDSRTTFGSTLASFVTEIFHECCPFGNTPLPLYIKLWELNIKTDFEDTLVLHKTHVLTLTIWIPNEPEVSYKTYEFKAWLTWYYVKV